MIIRCHACCSCVEADLDSPGGMRRVRIALGLSGKEAAEATGVTPGSLCNFEHGRKWAGMGAKRAAKYRAWLIYQLQQDAA